MWYTLNNKPALPAGRRALDEIVFRGRNKAYGAYVLRTEYEKTLFRAIFFVMLGVTLFFTTAWLLTREKIETQVDTGQISDTIFETIVTLPEQDDKKVKADPPKKKNDPPPSNNSSAATIYTVGSEDIVQIDSTSETAVIRIVAARTGSSDITVNTGGSVGVASGDTVGTAMVFENYQADMPEFEGGIKALRRFIMDNVRYPQNESTMNSGGLVMIRFVVDEMGNISAATVKHSGGSEFDNEALRVVRMLPRFKTPGKMGGRPVKVYFELPIRFK